MYIYIRMYINIYVCIYKYICMYIKKIYIYKLATGAGNDFHEKTM